jgi:hypothetical protein
LKVKGQIMYAKAKFRAKVKSWIPKAKVQNFKVKVRIICQRSNAHKKSNFEVQRSNNVGQRPNAGQRWNPETQKSKFKFSRSNFKKWRSEVKYISKFKFSRSKVK